MPGIVICSSFELFPSGHFLPSVFNVSTMNFNHSNGKQFLIKTVNAENVLRFDDEGLQITLAHPTDVLSLRSGTFGGKYEIQCMNISGDTVASQTISTNNTLLDHMLVGSQIQIVKFEGGGNEAVIAKVCVDITCK
ncbi:hypothetical protein IWQ49_005733 [Labrenzia sp. EL_126]|nr:hypothetical protein [Labrenzia sp. EL_126]